MAERPNKLCAFAGCPMHDRTIPDKRGQQAATKYHVECAYAVKLKQNAESDYRTLLRKLQKQ